MANRNDKMNRENSIAALNEDLSREYKAIISYVNYSQVLKGAAYMNIADALAIHASEELSHALQWQPRLGSTHLPESLISA